MTVVDFIEGFKTAADKEKYVAKHVTRNYIPYAEKLVFADRIINTSMYVVVNGVKTFKPNTLMRKFLFIMAIVEGYTDLDMGKEQQQLDNYDLLESNDATMIIMKAVGPDVMKLDGVVNMKLDDVNDMERSLVPYLDTKIAAWQMSINALSEAMKDAQEAKENTGNV